MITENEARERWMRIADSRAMRDKVARIDESMRKHHEQTEKLSREERLALAKQTSDMLRSK